PRSTRAEGSVQKMRPFSLVDRPGRFRTFSDKGRAVSKLWTVRGNRSNPAHGKKEQADDHHPEIAEKKNLPADNGTQKVSDGTSLIHSECSDLDLTQLKWT
ncbi:hypothetical protein THAOC_03985, partial [Thalassiosira oceanica]